MKKSGVYAPLYQALLKFNSDNPVSFHVPGHKNGTIFPNIGMDIFKSILSIDVTELSNLDDLHSPNGVIEQAQQLASDWFGSKSTYFLVGGSTVGNLAMILATCRANEKIIVQRNCHKSILNGLELSGASPIFVAPEFDEEVNRFTSPSVEILKKALHIHPDVKAIVLTYPDYYGRTFNIKQVIDEAHQMGVPVLVDEAHGVHFHLSDMFPPSALDLGADIVVQSAHKMAPAMTMGSYLHINSSIVKSEILAQYLRMLQSSSPSYPIMASLDLARYFLQNISVIDLDEIGESVELLTKELDNSSAWDLLTTKQGIDDPLKITIQAKSEVGGHTIASNFEKEKIFPELSTHQHVLFIHGLEPITQMSVIKKAVENVNQKLKIVPTHDTINNNILFKERITTLKYSYQEMKYKQVQFVSWANVVGHIAAEAVIPYPPGIPLITKGEIITLEHVKVIKYILNQGTSFQNRTINQGLYVFS